MPSGPAPHTTSSASAGASGCRLLLVRHAKAVPKEESVEDIERALSESGRADAARTGRWLAESGFTPALVLVSPARRTRQTWQLMAPALADPRTPCTTGGCTPRRRTRWSPYWRNGRRGSGAWP